MPLCLSVRKCDYDGSGSKWVFRLWSEWRHLDQGAGLEANVDRLGKREISSTYFVLCGCANFSAVLVLFNIVPNSSDLISVKIANMCTLLHIS